MLGGTNNAMFLQAISGFLVFPIIIALLMWAFPTKKDPVAKRERKALKKSLRELRRK
jgi:hypothetical protein